MLSLVRGKVDVQITLIKFRKRDGEIRFKCKYDKDRITFEHVVGKNESSFSSTIGKRYTDLFMAHGIYMDVEVDKHTMERYRPHVGFEP
jgi:hypothetical protein